LQLKVSPQINIDVLPETNKEFGVNKLDLKSCNKMKYFIENHSHITRMKNMALDIFNSSDKKIVSNVNINIGKPINNIVYYSKDYTEFIFIPKINSMFKDIYNHMYFLHRYIFLIVPMFLPLIAGLINLVFNIVSNSWIYFLGSPGLLYRIIINCILYLFYFLE